MESREVFLIRSFKRAPFTTVCLFSWACMVFADPLFGGEPGALRLIAQVVLSPLYVPAYLGMELAFEMRSRFGLGDWAFWPSALAVPVTIDVILWIARERGERIIRGQRV